MKSVKDYLRQWGRDGDILELEDSTATVELAANVLGVEPDRIAKSLSLSSGGDSAMIVVTAGNAKLDNRKFRQQFGFKAKMLSHEDTLRFTGHEVGGVCPFALPHGVKVYLDCSLQRFDFVYPACGSARSAIKLALPELELYSRSSGWVDVCKLPEG